MTYLIDNSSWYIDGGYCGLYPIKGNTKIAFKEFGDKQRAKIAWSIQKKLHKYSLAPKVYGNVCKLKLATNTKLLSNSKSEWGYITELAKITTNKKIVSLSKIQELVDNIYTNTGLKFWDCHYHNIGILRNKLVCIDTGKESFSGESNAWFNVDPGPKCSYCLKYKCQCKE